MGRVSYHVRLEDQLRDLGIQISALKQTLAEGIGQDPTVKLLGILAQLEDRHGSLRASLRALEDEPDAIWAERRVAFEAEWNNFVKDIERSLGTRLGGSC